MSIKIVQDIDFNEKGFVGIPAQNGIEIEPRISKLPGNKLSLKDDGLAVVENASPTLYNLDFGNGVTSGGSTEDPNRRLLAVKNNLGIIHLDFRTTNGNRAVARLPAGAPRPIMLIEIQLEPGTNQTMYISPNSGTIWGQNLPVNQRIIVDMVGYFN